jgi:transposase
MNTARKPYPSEVSDAEWELLAPFLTQMREDAPQREHALRDLFNALRYVVGPGVRGAIFPMIFHRGLRCISKPGAGWRRRSSKRLHGNCG